MENLKIRVNSKSMVEVLSIFRELGYHTHMEDHEYINKGAKALYAEKDEYGSGFDYVVEWDEGELFNESNHREITLTQLRDMVVLKRNSVGDATHECKQDPDFKYRLINNWWHCITPESKEWRKDSITLDEAHLFIKPIEKPMKEYLEIKEYLDPDDNFSYHKCPVLAQGSNWIEVPDGAECLTKCVDLNRDKWLVFWKDNYKFCVGYDADWVNMEYNVHEYLVKWRSAATVLWQRPQQPEALPFIDDELKSQWDIQVGGNHYKDMKIQPAKFAMENKLDYCQSNAIKYIVRHASKNGKQDLEKAKHYIDLMIEFYYGENKNG